MTNNLQVLYANAEQLYKEKSSEDAQIALQQALACVEQALSKYKGTSHKLDINLSHITKATNETAESLRETLTKAQIKHIVHYSQDKMLLSFSCVILFLNGGKIEI